MDLHGDAGAGELQSQRCAGGGKQLSADHLDGNGSCQCHELDQHSHRIRRRGDQYRTSNDSASNPTTINPSGGGGGGLNENFESRTVGWAATGLWHLVNNSGCVAPALGYSSPTHAFYYGQDTTCNYATGTSPNTGTLTSPSITGITAQSTLSFSYYLGTEGTPGYDTATVSAVVGGVLTTLQTLTTNDASWHPVTGISLAQFAGQTIQIRFTFNTVDGYTNNLKGWLVDDLAVN